MHVFNIHRREIRASAHAVGSLIDTLASRNDRLWPRADWPAMRFDRPGLAAAGVGGHGPVGYRVEHHDPGRSVTFTFTGRPSGLYGRHGYIVEVTGPDRCTLWHLTDVKPRGLLRLTWTPFWAPLHDALIEDSLDRAQAFAEPEPPLRQQWSWYVRLLRALTRASRRARTPQATTRHTGAWIHGGPGSRAQVAAADEGRSA